jgi:Lrp/AsnC family leucine-responsive transcriptional regulator
MKNSKEVIDATDARILSALQSDGRLSNTRLAEIVGLSPSPCLRRVQRLEQEGHITSYRAILGRREVGLGVTVFLSIRIEGHADERADALQDAFVALPEVVSCHMVSGEMDYLLEVAVPDLEAYQSLLVDRLLEWPIIKEVRSTIAIQCLKSTSPLPLAHLPGGTRG